MNNNLKIQSLEVRRAKLPSGLGTLTAVCLLLGMISIVAKQWWLGGLASLGLGITLFVTSIGTLIRRKAWVQFDHGSRGHRNAEYDREKTPMQFFALVLGVMICSLGLFVLGFYLLLRNNI